MTDGAVTSSNIFTYIHIDKVSGFPDTVFVVYLLQT